MSVRPTLDNFDHALLALLQSDADRIDELAAELEKLEAGEPYMFLDEEVAARKESAVVLARAFNDADPTDHEIREGLSGNFCRCTGYQGIVNAVKRAAQSLAEGAVR